jgi:hypothetical protein
MTQNKATGLRQLKRVEHLPSKYKALSPNHRTIKKNKKSTNTIPRKMKKVGGGQVGIGETTD